jgi:hypothetical protein
MLLQLIRANHPSLTAKLLKSNLLAWNEYVQTNPLANDRMTKDYQSRYFIEDGLPWQYMLDVNGDPITIDASDLLVSVDRLDNMLFEFNQIGMTSEIVSATHFGSVATIEKETSTVTLERVGSFALKTRDLVSNLQGTSFSPSEPFLQICPNHVVEMGNILETIGDRVSQAKSKLTELKIGETTDTKRQQAHTFTQLDSLICGLEIQSRYCTRTCCILANRTAITSS